MHRAGCRQVWHDNDSRRNAAGLPDLILLGPGGLAFAELKKQKGRVSPEQQGWLDGLTRVGVPAYLWRPSDWPEVQAVLRGLARPGRAP